MPKANSIALLLILALSVSCNTPQQLKEGTAAFERKQYAVAITLLQKDFKKAKTRLERGKLAFMLAESYSQTNQSDAALDWYQKAYDNQYGIDALKAYAFTLKKAERYTEAMQAFKELGLEIGSPYEFRREINACEIALGWQGIQEVEYQTELADFNTGFAEYSPVLWENDQLVFTSDRQPSQGKSTYFWTGNKFSDFFVADLRSGAVNTLELPFNTDNNEGTICFNRSFTEAFFSRCFGDKKEDSYCKIMYSFLKNGVWSEPRPLEFVKDQVNYSSPWLSDDGQTLYFSSNDPDGWGGYDIWFSRKNADGGWDDPQTLGRNINTTGNEKFPTLHADTLYFSSDGHTGMGGLDIFKTYPLNANTWAPPFNLKPPVNSGGDDFGLVVYASDPQQDVLQTGFFSSTRFEGIGNDDIYRFEKRVLPPKPEPPAEEQEQAIVYSMKLEGYVLEKIYQDPNNPNSRVIGRKPLNGASVQIEAPGLKTTVVVGEDGFFSIDLDKDKDYRFLGSANGYLNNQALFSTAGIGEDPNNPQQVFEIEVVLDKIFLGQEIVLENIYYDFDKWDIREDAMPTLNALADNLLLNPNINIQLSSHTDCRGGSAYNEQLSQRRAISAVEYLISKGISPDRLAAKGYGESLPAVDCICARCTEEQHQTNRRTTFTIIE
ncbi:MAG: OmpA family protein [Saprospiraceae bacterium]|nr:OmpA family protein [Saprospiraceae bacterium]MDP4997849.1 OmpA family protein [Saprospiraceae bacterium]